VEPFSNVEKTTIFPLLSLTFLFQQVEQVCTGGYQDISHRVSTHLHCDGGDGGGQRLRNSQTHTHTSAQFSHSHSSRSSRSSSANKAPPCQIITLTIKERAQGFSTTIFSTRVSCSEYFNRERCSVLHTPSFGHLNVSTVEFNAFEEASVFTNSQNDFSDTVNEVQPPS